MIFCKCFRSRLINIVIMAIETEHKYLVTDESFKQLATKKIHIIQGYLSKEAHRTVRVRIADDKAYLTVKGKNVGDSRLEFEYEIPLSDAQEMLELCDGTPLDKTRYIVMYKGYRWEVDEYHNRKAATVAEIELKESNHEYPLPPFCGKEVTGDPRYYNSLL